MLETTRTYVARITNHSQVRDDLETHLVSDLKQPVYPNTGGSDE